MTPSSYLDKVRACWIGKCLGGAIGTPFEGVPYTVALREQDIHLSEVPNDDLELQLVWLDAIRRHGLSLSARDLGETWLARIPHGCDEYSIALYNLRHGIPAPQSGRFDNFFADGMGATIRSEIWALLFAGRPDAAAHFAAQDAQVDHWGDGVRGECFMAAAEAHACEHSDVGAALRHAFSRVEPGTRLHRALSRVFSLFDAGVPDAEARRCILLEFQRTPNFTDCVMNLAFVADSLLRGRGDFLRTVLSAIAYGRDTDCTAASCGAFLGAAFGTAVLPPRWAGAMAGPLFLSDFVRRIPGVPTTLDELVRQTAELHGALAPRLPSAPYPGYVPCDATAPMPDLHASRWLVLEDAPGMADLESRLLAEGRCPAEYADRAVGFHSRFLDLSPYAHDARNLHLFTFIDVENRDTPPEEMVLSATADVGMVLRLDGRRIFNHHAKLKMLPSFHRAEGGAALSLPLQPGSRHLLHAELYYALPPLRACFMFGNLSNDHLDGFRFSI